EVGRKTGGEQVVQTLRLFVAARYGSWGLVHAPCAPFYLMLLVSVAALGQDRAIPPFLDNPLAKPVLLTQTANAATDSATLSLAGSLAQIASAGGWDTSLTLVNLGTAAGQARLNFYSNDGSAWSLPHTFPQQPSPGAAPSPTI